MKLPSPLPDTTPEEWQQLTSRDNGCRCRLGLQMVETKWGADPSSQVRHRPNKARSTRDEGTRNWNRKPGHFVLQLHFGNSALQIQECLQGQVGATLAQVQKDNREQGRDAVTNLFVNRTKLRWNVEKEKERGKRTKEKDPRGKGRGRKGGKKLEYNRLLFHLSFTQALWASKAMIGQTQQDTCQALVLLIFPFPSPVVNYN